MPRNTGAHYVGEALLCGDLRQGLSRTDVNAALTPSHHGTLGIGRSPRRSVATGLAANVTKRTLGCFAIAE